MAEPLTPAQLVEVVRADRRQRWTHGDRVLAETYLQRYPALLADTNLAVELVYHEVLLREEMGETFALEEYLQRFPQLTAQLEPLFEVHRALGPGGVFDTPPPKESGRLTPQLARPPQDLLWPEVPGYELLDGLGKGGMGVVYKARHLRLGREVALKLIAAEAGPADRARFRGEAEAQARLQHPHIVQIHEVGEAAGRPYLALEYVAGGSLDKQLAGKPQAAPAAAQLVETLARAVHYAHQRGLVHRDLKPANVLLTADGTPKVSDFGLAKRLQEAAGLTRSGEIVGTPSYMAPEQAAPRPTSVGPVADVYALGAILYELLTGRPPFLAETVLDTLLQVRLLDPVPPRRLQPKVPKDLETICLRSLHKEPTRRYASALALADDLRHFQQGEAIAARPVGLGERAVRWARRRPELAALLLALVAVVGGSLLGLTALWWRAERQRDRAVQAEAAATAERDKVVAEKARADEEAAVALAVSDFLQNGLLRQADSRRQADGRFTPDPDVKVRTLLDRAASEIETRLRDQPRVAGAVRLAIGDAYLGVGAYERAAEQLRAALELHVTYLGPDHVATVMAQGKLARAYRLAGKLPQAIRLYEQIRDRLTSQLGPDDPRTLGTLDDLAGTYLDAGKIRQAIRLREQVRDRLTSQLGPDHPDTLNTLHNLARAYRHADRIAEAIRLYEQVRDREVATLGPNHPRTLNTLNNLAVAYRNAGRLPEAIRLCKQVSDQQAKILGPGHPDTLRTLDNLAGAYQDAGRLPEAVRLFEQLRDQSAATLGPDHPHTLQALHNLAYAYRPAGRLPEAIHLLEQVRDQKLRLIGPNHPDTLRTQGALALAYLDAGRITESVQLHEQLRAQCIEQLGADHSVTVAMSFNLAQALQSAKQLDRAAALYREVLDAEARRTPMDDLARARALVVLGGCLLEAGNPVEAEPLLREALTVREKKRPGHWTTFNTKSLLGGSLAALQKYAEAEPLLVAGYDGLKQHQDQLPANARQRPGEACERLVQLYDAWGKPDQAARWRAERAKLPKPPEPPQAK